MVTRLKFLIFGAVIGLLFGLWFGVNLGKGNPLYANPFADPDVTERIKGGAQGVLEEGKEGVRKALE